MQLIIINKPLIKRERLNLSFKKSFFLFLKPIIDAVSRRKAEIVNADGNKNIPK
jgi:hypothetical protein